jgi:hypothetical protein
MVLFIVRPPYLNEEDLQLSENGATELSSDTYFWPSAVPEVEVQLEYKGLMQNF